MTTKNKRALLLYCIQLCASIQIHWWIQTRVTVRKRSIEVQIRYILSCVTLKFDDDLGKQKGTSSILHQALCIISNHWWIPTRVTVRKRSIQVEIRYILSCVTLKFDRWPWKIKGHLFYTTSSFVHHFKSIGEFKLELQSGNTQLGSKSAIFCPVWPWNLTDDIEKQYGTSPMLCYAMTSFVHHFIAIVEFKLEL